MNKLRWIWKHSDVVMAVLFAVSTIVFMALVVAGVMP